MREIEIPEGLVERLGEAARQRGYSTIQGLAFELVARGVEDYPLLCPPTLLEDRLVAVVEEHGYASLGELMEDLLERGLLALEGPQEEREGLEERLRGLGYID